VARRDRELISATSATPGAVSARTGRSPARLIGVVPAVFLGLFFLVPLVAVLDAGLRTQGEWRAAEALDIATAARTWRLMTFTAAQAVLSSVATLVIGLPLAFVLARFRFPGAALLRSLLLVPFVLPTVVVGAAFVALIGPRGALGIELTGTLPALIAAHVFLNLAVVVRTVGSLLAQLDPRAEDAARTLGASRWGAFRTVTLPLVMPAVVAAGVVVTLFCFTSFGLVQVLGAGRLRTVEVEIYRATLFDLDLTAAAVLALLQLLAVIGLLLVVERTQRRRDVAARLVDPRQVRRAPRGAERPIVALIAVAGAVIAVVPLAVLVLGSFRTEAGWTTAAWQALFTDTGSTAFIDPWVAIRTSLTSAAAAALLAVIVGVCAAYAVRRPSAVDVGGSAHRPGVDAILMLPLGTSAVTVGLGLFLALDTPPIDLRDSWVLVPIAQALVAVPFVVRILVPSLRGIDPRLLAAARTLGASPGQAERTVVWPVLRIPLAVASGFAFAVAFGEFGATAFLARADAPTLPVAIARLLSRPGELLAGQAYAASVLLMVVTLVVVLLVDRVRASSLGEF
jgi:thiamine transport system permease protein